MARTFHLTVAKVGENLFDGDALSATLPGTDGTFTVLAGHEAFVSPLKAGEILIKPAQGEDIRLTIEAGGIAEVSGTQSTVIL